MWHSYGKKNTVHSAASVGSEIIITKMRIEKKKIYKKIDSTSMTHLRTAAAHESCYFFAV